jgi:transcriptional regulator with XRE-family HTH domain
MSEVLGKRLRYLRDKSGLSQKFVAEKIGVKNNTLSGYEAGDRDPSLELLGKLANFYEVTTDYLTGRSDSPIFTKSEETFLNDIDLSLDDIKEKYNLIVDGEPASKEEIRGAIAWIKANRMMNGEQKK